MIALETLHSAEIDAEWIKSQTRHSYENLFCYRNQRECQNDKGGGEYDPPYNPGEGMHVLHVLIRIIGVVRARDREYRDQLIGCYQLCVFVCVVLRLD